MTMSDETTSSFVRMLSYKKGDGHNWRPVAGQTCLISPPHSDNEEGYVYQEYEVLWLNETFVCYRKKDCWPVVNKWEHIRAKPSAIQQAAQPVAPAPATESATPSGGVTAQLVQACRPEDRAMLATPEGAELVSKAVAALTAQGEDVCVWRINSNGQVVASCGMMGSIMFLKEPQKEKRCYCGLPLVEQGESDE